MPFFYMDDPTFWDDISHPWLRWVRDSARGPGMETGAIRMSGDDAEAPPMAQLLQIPPNHVVPKHAHFCERVEVVIKGSIDVGNGRILHPGDVMISGPGEYYGPHAAGPDGATTVEIFSD